MSADLSWMLAPILACLVTIAALGWFGLHVLQRGVIFVDLALAQIAAMGAIYAVYLGYSAESPVAMGMSLLFTVIGALAFTTLREFEDWVPQEALIGISYAVSAALGILLIELAADPHGAEKIQHLLVGNIVWVRWSEIATAALALGAVGVVHAVFRHPLLQVSLDPEQARAEGRRIAAWDLLFYLSFGIVITAIVNIVGVLLVFSFLVIPAVIARLISHAPVPRLLIAWALGGLVSVVGVAISYEHSTGPIIVTLLGAALLVTLLISSVVRAPSPARRLAKIAVGGVVFMGLLAGTQAMRVEPTHSHTDHAMADHAHEVHHEDHDDHNHSDEAAPTDPLSRLEQAVTAARSGDPAGLRSLAALTQEDAVFIRMEAHDRLVAVAGAGAVDFDPLLGPDTDGRWRAWAESPPEDWASRAAALPLP